MFSNPLQRSILVGSLLLAAGLAPPLAGATAAATGKISSAQTVAAASAADGAHRALRDAIWRLERTLRGRLAAGGRTHSRDIEGDEPRLPRLETLLGVLRDSGRKLGGAEGTSLARKAAALEVLLREVERQERAPAGAPLAASAWDVGTVGSRLDSAQGATCADAIAVGDGHFTAAVGPSAGGARDQIWLRYAVPAGVAAAASTAGSDFDTVVEVYRACPAGDDEPIARGDDEIGLQARASFRAAKGESVWVRIAGADGATGTVALQLEGGQSGFQGVVTDEATGLAPNNASVQIRTASGFFLGSAYVSGDGTYLATLSPGTYYASTQTQDWEGLLDELYDDVPCAGGPPAGCSLTAGAPIVVQAGTVYDGVDFDLGHGAAVAGRVRDASNGQLLANLNVEVYGSAGQLVAQTMTDGAGRFLVSGLASGVAYATAGPSYGSLRRELYQDIGCTPTCNVTSGTPIPVTEGQTTPNVDFALEQTGAIGGTLTRVADGSPVTYAYVKIWDAQGHAVSEAWTDGVGDYVSGGLDAGQYFVTTDTAGAFLDELYDDLPCEPSCGPTTGAPVAVTLGHVTTGIDFALRRMGTISGHLTDAVTGDPIFTYFSYGAYISVFNASGTLIGTRVAFLDQYQVTGLPAGTYYLRATHPDYRAELYDDHPCPSGCDPTTGTPIVVTIDGDVTGIDFALTPLGSISGTMTDANSHAPLDGYVQLWNSTGQLVTYVSVYGGNYRFSGLADGNYFLTAWSGEYSSELYDNLPCPGGPPSGCVPTNGTAVQATLGAPTSGIDFALLPQGKIAGTVRDAATSQPISYAPVWIFNSAGVQVHHLNTDYYGDYESYGLDPGNYFVVADGGAYSGYDAEVYDDVPCPNAACNPTIGTAVPVTVGAVTAGIDFGLSPSNVITGIARGPNGAPLSGVDVTLYDAGGQSRGSTSSDGQGHYELPAEPGTWYVLAHGGYYYLSELYAGIHCSGNCDVTTGTPVVLTEGVDTPNVDFDLIFAHGIMGRVLDHGHPLPGVAIDLWNAAGVHVASTLTAENGAYHFEPDGGTYFVSTDSGMGAVEELWNNVPCPLGPAYQGLCDPTTGTPIPLASEDSLVTSIDFSLDGVALFENGFEPGSHGWSATWPP